MCQSQADFWCSERGVHGRVSILQVEMATVIPVYALIVGMVFEVSLQYEKSRYVSILL